MILREWSYRLEPPLFDTLKHDLAKRSTLPLVRNPAAFSHIVIFALYEQQGLENRSLDSNALSAATAGGSTPPATLPISHSAANSSTAALPSTAPASLPGPSSHQDRSRAEEDLVLPTSPQQQQRLRMPSGPTSPGSSNQNNYVDNDDDDDDKAAARVSCSISAVTTPRAAWAEEGSILDDAVFGGGSKADDHSSDAAGSPGFQQGARLSLGENGSVNGSPMVPATADMMFHDEARCTDGLEGSRGLDSNVAQQPRRAAFGKPSTKVCRLCMPGLHLTTARCFLLSLHGGDRLVRWRDEIHQLADEFMLLTGLLFVLEKDVARQNKRPLVQNHLFSAINFDSPPCRTRLTARP